MAGGDLSMAPGSIVVVRDEEWLVSSAEHSGETWRVEVQGLTELVRNSRAIFFSDLDRIEVLDPRDATLVTDVSPRYRRARLWLEATLRKTPIPHGDPRLAVSQRMLIDPLIYQRQAVAHALSPSNLRPRLLIADAVGLGKTLEIGMILSELARRGRAERILVVTPRHVLDQMQHELWCRFALPLVRLDSEGIQRIRQTLPASRNPFTFFNRVIVSIDTLKSPQHRANLEKQRWDVVVIDESHNITNTATLNNDLANILAPTTEALILASATPHNGKRESFAELLRLLDPTAVGPDDEFSEADVRRLLLRRHRNSPAVAAEVGAQWTERPQPQVMAVQASPAEDAIADELAEVWLYPREGRSPYSGHASTLFSWTLAKAFLSSPAALQESVRNRRKRLDTDTTAGAAESVALDRLDALATAALDGGSAKLSALTTHLTSIGIGRTSATRVVLFAERVATLDWLQASLPNLLGMKPAQFAVLHGGLADVEQQRIVEDFKLAHSGVRVLITGDVASEGVNLHAHCHHLVHVDLPWSLIRIEQRNGRIDRYGQHFAPQITALALMPGHERFSGDIRVLQRLLAKEHEAHTTLGDAASLMGKHAVDDEEDEIRRMLAHGGDLEATVPDPAAVLESQDPLAVLDRLFGTADASALESPETDDGYGLFRTDLDFLATALSEIYAEPANPPGDRGDSGVSWQTYPGRGLVELVPPADLKVRLDVLPQGYLRDRKVKQKLILATSPEVGNAHLAAAREQDSGTIWPEAHYLSPLHPVLDWICDKVLSDLGRNEVFAIHGDVSEPTAVLIGTLMNHRGQVVSRQFVTVAFPTTDPSLALPQTHPDLGFLDSTGLRAGAENPGGVPITDQLRALIPAAVEQAIATLRLTQQAQTADLTVRLTAWRERARAWTEQAEQLELFGTAKSRLTRRERRIFAEQEIAASLAASQQLVRPLILVIPRGNP